MAAEMVPGDALRRYDRCGGLYLRGGNVRDDQGDCRRVQ